MDVAAGAASAAAAAAGRGVSLGIPPQPPRQEWRAVSEPPVRITANELGRDTGHVDFCTINLDEDILQQRLHDVVRRREEMQRSEVELRAQIIARKDVMLMQKDFDAQMTEQVNANTKLQEKLAEMERTIHERERQIQEKEREIHAIQLDHEAAWAKEDLLREQSKELHTFRRERDNSEAERTQHLKQILDLQEHFQEKERLFLELQEQNRVSQETILFKDEQLGEAQAWIARFQEMQSTSNLSLQAELRERTEQYNQLWISYQQQLSEMERIYVHTVHQHQLELASARERSGSFLDESQLPQIKSKDASQPALNNGSQIDVNGSGTADTSSGPLSNGNAENVTSNSSNQTEHVHGVPLAPPSLIGVPTYLQHGQVPAMHPFVIHQGVHPVPSHVSHFHSIPAMSSLQQWQNQQTVPEASILSNQHEYPSSHMEQNLHRSDSNYDYSASGNVQAVAASVQSSSQVGSTDMNYLVHSQPHESLQHITSQFNDSVRLESDSVNEPQEKGTNNNSSKLQHEKKELLKGQSSPTSNAPTSERPNNSNPIINVGMSANKNASGADAFISSEQNSSYGTGNIIIDLLDERTLLACIVRTIPPSGSGGRIRISSTLPNRLGKMLAPLHWHDYKKKYGKLDEFLANHPELFAIEGDFIQVREGAQEIIAATAAVAKVAAAAAKTTSVVFGSQSSLPSPSVAVTPMAQSQQRVKRTPSIDPNAGVQILRKTQAVNGQSSQVSSLANGGANLNKQQPRTTAKGHNGF
ncbi:uncharacterized protein LOC124931461 isoform X2 [Impatiens glandulifera]|uniref:uncharacterized protein LOC124931461 isoform X2 n=1 Tax=Impatiens glandulifera TaxID=253017 RepID=UPI001FB11A9E|nr:uncharacterized protein LOC124931461 isoform X2 [Impatiens glandulifera]